MVSTVHDTENTDLWLADNQSRALNNEFWLVVFLQVYVDALTADDMKLVLSKTGVEEHVLSDIVLFTNSLNQQVSCFVLAVTK